LAKSGEQRKRGIVTPITIVVLFTLALLTRLNAVWQGFITPDEPFWVFSSIHFMRALETHRWTETLQIGHPGVTTMWVGTLGVLWQRWRDTAEATAHLAWVDHVPWIAPENAELFPHLIPFLPPARVAMAVLTSLGVAGIYALACRLWDRHVALIGAVLLAFDPFLVALSGLLHVDALATTFITLSLLAWLIALRDRQARSFPHRFLLASFSGLCAGLGVLSKSPAIFLVAAVGVTAIMFFVLGPRSRQHLGHIASLGLVWSASAALAVWGAFPGMWEDPLGMARRIYGLALRYHDQAHEITFYRGISGGDPGSWFYPTAFLFRLTPITLIGLCLSPLALLPDRLPLNRRRAIWASMWLFVIGFTIFINLGAKKFDRYLLPTFPALNLLAAMGWVHAVRRILATRWLAARLLRSRSKPQMQAKAFATLSIVLLVGQGAMILTGWPYYLDAYNPLAGGIGAARRTLPVGWGEGLEQMAAYLNRQPDAANRVVAGASPVTLGPLFDGKVMMLDESSRLLADDVLITALDRQIAPQRVDKLISGTSLVHTVRAGGQEILWLYRSQHRAEADHLARYGAPEDVVVCDAATPFARHPPKEAVPGTVQLLADADEGQVVEMLNRWSSSHARLWYLAYPNASPITASHIRRQLDTYAARLDEVDLGYVTATLYILPDPPSFAVVESPFQPAHFGQVVVSDAILLDQQVTADGGVRFLLRWRATSNPQTDRPQRADYAPFVHLIDPAGHLRAAGRGDDLLVDERYWSTSAWSPGDGVELPYRLSFPPGLPPGPYQIAVGLSDAQTGAWIPVLDEQGKVRGTTATVLPVDVGPADRPPDPYDLKLPYPQSITWRNQLKLLGSDHPSQANVGETLVVGLAWLGLNMFNEDYALRLGLRTTEGEMVHEQAFPLSVYATSHWRRGELIHELYDVRLPAGLEDDEYALSIQVLDQEGRPLASPLQIGTIAVSVQERLFELPRAPQYALDLRLGDPATVPATTPGAIAPIALLGYDLPHTTVQPGEELPLNLYWRCESPVDTSYTVFVHLLDAGNQVRGQRDGIPMHGRAPTSGWVEGQIVVDEYAIPISGEAQPGPHRIEVGMYNVQDMVRLPVLDSEGNRLPDDRVLLEAEVIVSAGKTGG